MACGQGCHLAFDQLACARELQGSPLSGGLLRAALGRPAAKIKHVDARADAHLYHALDLQRDQRLAQGGATDAELPGQVALCRQPRPRRKLALANGLA